MRILITIISILFITNVKAQTNYDRRTQDPKIANTDLKVITTQNDIVLMKADIAQLKIYNAQLQKKLDSVKIFIVQFSQKFTVMQGKDTIKIDIK